MATITLDLELNKAGLTEGFEESFLEANGILGRQFQQAISSNIWNWADGSLRDIVDTGALRDSYTPQELSRTEYEHTWAIDYALPVLLGAVFSSRNGSLPARNWILYVLRRTDFGQLVEDLL